MGDGGINLNGGSVTGDIATNGAVTGSGTVNGNVYVAGAVNTTYDQQFATQNSSINVGDTAVRANVAQSFKTGMSTPGGGYLRTISVNLKKVGTPGNLTLMLLGDNAGSPSKTVLASTTIASTSISTSAYGFATTTFLTSIPITS